jgi:hypothetical protein
MTRLQRQLLQELPSFGRWKINMAGASVESSIRSDIIGRSVSLCRDLHCTLPVEVPRVELIRSYADCVQLVGNPELRPRSWETG